MVVLGDLCLVGGLFGDGPFGCPCSSKSIHRSDLHATRLKKLGKHGWFMVSCRILELFVVILVHFFWSCHGRPVSWFECGCQKYSQFGVFGLSSHCWSDCRKAFDGPQKEILRYFCSIFHQKAT